MYMIESNPALARDALLTYLTKPWIRRYQHTQDTHTSLFIQTPIPLKTLHPILYLYPLPPTVYNLTLNHHQPNQHTTLFPNHPTYLQNTTRQLFGNFTLLPSKERVKHTFRSSPTHSS